MSKTKSFQHVRSGFITAIALCAAFAAPTSAAAVQFTVESQGTLTDVQLTALQRAVSFQVDHQVAKLWPGSVASFGPDGVPINIVSLKSLPNGDWGYHDWGSTVGPAVYVADLGLSDTQMAFDHEVVETVVNPTLDDPSREICDPVEGWTYTGVGGVTLADFVGPARDWLSQAAASATARRSHHRSAIRRASKRSRRATSSR